mgnify:CR=1 FL=1
MIKAPDSVLDVCITIDELCSFAGICHLSDNAILRELLLLFSSVCKNDSISAEWRRFLWGYAAGSFPFFAYRVYGIYKWIDCD